MAFRLDHVGLAVADLATAADWYRGAFGLDTDLVLRVDELGLDIVMLIHPTYGYRVELLSRAGSSVGAKPADPAAAAARHGYGHIAFEVGDVDAEFDRVVAAGARPVMAPRPAPEPGARMAFVADPEGNLIELLHR